MIDSRVIKVSAKSPVPQLASSIVICIENGDSVELRAIGAGAVSQMYKAVASARGMIAVKGKDLYIIPGFDTIVEDDMEKTVMVARLVVK